MVARYLRLAQAQPLMDGLAERAHCAGSDSVITLAKAYQAVFT